MPADLELNQWHYHRFPAQMGVSRVDLHFGSPPDGLGGYCFSLHEVRVGAQAPHTHGPKVGHSGAMNFARTVSDAQQARDSKHWWNAVQVGFDAV